MEFAFVLECSSYLDGSALGLLPLGTPDGGSVVLDAALALITRAFPLQPSSIFIITTDARFKKGFVEWGMSRGLCPENVQCSSFTPPAALAQATVVFIRDNMLLPSEFALAAFLREIGTPPPPIILLDQELARRQHPLQPTPLLSRSDYDAAMSALSSPTNSGFPPPVPPTPQPERVVSTCPARIGMMGNPSDGFQGKTLSFLLDNFRATVTLSAPAPPLAPTAVHISPNPQLDPVLFGDAASASAAAGSPSQNCGGMGALARHTTVHGYYGGHRLVQAACFTFAKLAMQTGHVERVSRKGVVVNYSTDIPRMVGLSGSSAIIIATFRGLLTYYGLSLADLALTVEELPTVMLDIERRELGISAGLQDRVVQCYGGLVHMDFTLEGVERARRVAGTRAGAAAGKGVGAGAGAGAADSIAPPPSFPLIGGTYTPLPPSLLPPLYLAYNIAVGGDSGKVHSTVRERWAARDPVLVSGMQGLAALADRARDVLLEQLSTPPQTPPQTPPPPPHAACAEAFVQEIASLMRENFATRRSLYGDSVVGRGNIDMILRAQQELGLSCKFTGSGGALVCCRSDGGGWLGRDEEERAVAVFAEGDFVLVRVRPCGDAYSY